LHLPARLRLRVGAMKHVFLLQAVVVIAAGSYSSSPAPPINAINRMVDNQGKSI
jgi:hypothetical protein